MKNKKIFFNSLFFLVFVSLSLFSPRLVNSQELPECQGLVTIAPSEVVEGNPVEITFYEELAAGTYTIDLKRGGIFIGNGTTTFKVISVTTNFPLTQTIDYTKYNIADNIVDVYLKKDGDYFDLCGAGEKGFLGSYKIINAEDFSHYSGPEFNVVIEGSSNGNPNCIDTNSTVTINFENFKRVLNNGTEEPVNGSILLDLRSSSNVSIAGEYRIVEDGKFSVIFGPGLTPSEDSTLLKIYRVRGSTEFEEMVNLKFMPIHLKCEKEDDDQSRLTPGPVNLGQYNICQGNQDCLKCFDEGKAWTALGCIPTEPMDLVKWLFPYFLGFGGLAAFGLIVYSGFQLMISSGDPQKIQGAKETITSAVTGLIFIILSLFLLRLIGVNILGLPGLE